MPAAAGGGDKLLRVSHLAKSDLEAQRNQSRGKKAYGLEAVAAAKREDQFVDEGCDVYFRRLLQQDGEVLERDGKGVTINHLVQECMRGRRAGRVLCANSSHILFQLLLIQWSDGRRRPVGRHRP